MNFATPDPGELARLPGAESVERALDAQDLLLFPASLDNHADAPRVRLGADLGDTDAHPGCVKFIDDDLILDIYHKYC